MKKIFAIIWKDAVVRFASSSELIFFIVLPLIFTFLLAGGTPKADGGDTRIRLVIVDQANTPISNNIIAELDKSTAVRPETLTLYEAESQFNSRRASVVLILPAGLDLQAIQDGTAHVDFRQQTNNLNATVVERAVQTAIRQVSSAIKAATKAVKEAEKKAPFATKAERLTYFDTSLKLAQSIQADAPERVTIIEGSAPDKVAYDPRANASAGQLVTWVFIPLFAISAMFAYERQQGTLRRILTTPTSKGIFLLGTIAGQVMMALIQMSLLIMFGIFAMKLSWGRDPLALFVILTAAALAAGAIGTTMGTFVKTEGQASGLSIMMGMIMALLGGCWYPLELFPTVVQNIVKLLPTTWAMQGLLTLVLRGGGLIDILPAAGVLLGFAVIFFSIGVMRFRYE